MAKGYERAQQGYIKHEDTPARVEVVNDRVWNGYYH